MIIFLAGGISGNLKPAFRNMARNNDISQNGFIKALKDENFWQGGGVTALDTRRNFAQERE